MVSTFDKLPCVCGKLKTSEALFMRLPAIKILGEYAEFNQPL